MEYLTKKKRKERKGNVHIRNEGGKQDIYVGMCSRMRNKRDFVLRARKRILMVVVVMGKEEGGERESGVVFSIADIPCR